MPGKVGKLGKEVGYLKKKRWGNYSRFMPRMRSFCFLEDKPRIFDVVGRIRIWHESRIRFGQAIPHTK